MNPSAFWSCSYLPWELPLAFDFTPRRLWGITGATPRADRFLPANLCSYSRTFYEKALQATRDKDIFLIADCCDSNRRLADALEETFPSKVFLLSLPHARKHWPFFSAELKRLASFLEVKREVTLEWEKLERAYTSIEDLRKIWQKLEERKRQGKVTALTYFHALRALNTLPCQEAEPEIISALGVPVRPPRLRTFLLGTSLDDEEVWRLFDELGLRVVGDDLCYGEKQFETSPELERSDPFGSLARGVLSRPPCPRFTDLEDRWEGLLRKMLERNTEAVIFFATKYCDAYSYDRPILGEKLRASGIPLLILEQDYTQRTDQQLRTRLEAFCERL